MNKLVVLDDAIIFSLLNDTAFTAQVPCLQNKKEVFTSGTSGCGVCMKKRQERQRREMAAIKSCIAGLSAEKKAALKQKLNAEQIRIMYTDLSGQTVQLTF